MSGKKPVGEYVAEPAEKLNALFLAKMKKAQEESAEMAALLPQLRSIPSLHQRPKIRFYEGKDGIQQVYEDTLTSPETILAWANVEDVEHTLPHYFPEYYKRRTQKGIKIKAIFPNTPMARARSDQDKNENRETALVPPEDYFFSPEINIYGNKIMIASWRAKLGVTIESAEIAGAMKTIFKLAWKEAKRLDPRK